MKRRFLCQNKRFSTYLLIKKRKLSILLDLFIEKDYEDVNIRMLTSKAGISIGSFYKYFDNKDDLYLYLMSEIEKDLCKGNRKGWLFANE